MVRIILTLSGRVQAVGFRDAVLRIAVRYDVAGTVRNLRNGGRLQIDVEGDEAVVEAFIADVLAHPPHYARVAGVARATAAPRGSRAFELAPTAVTA